MDKVEIPEPSGVFTEAWSLNKVYGLLAVFGPAAIVASVAIDQVLPIRIASTNLPAQRIGHRGGLNIQGLVVFNDTDCFSKINLISINVDDLQKYAQIQLVKKFFGLRRVRTAID